MNHKFVRVDNGEITLIEGEPSLIFWDESTKVYDFEEGDFTVISKMRKAVGSVWERARRFAERHEAILLSDPEAVEAVLPVDEDEALPPEPVVDQEDVYEDGMSKGPEISVDEAALDQRLLDQGVPADEVDEMSLEQKLARLAADVEAPPVKEGEVRGYRLIVNRPEWPVCASGRPRFFEVGDSCDLAEITRIKDQWSEAGFRSEIAPLAIHPRASVAQHTIWTGKPYLPIICLVPGCDWVGDHLGPHLRKHGFSTTAAYQEVTHYEGPSLVGKAALALEDAHKEVRRRNDLRVGQLLVEIIGTHAIVPWRIVSKTPEGIGLERLSDSTIKVFGYEELFKGFRPVGLWTRRMLRENGCELKRARRIQRRREGLSA